ncbi:hypothetical protein LQ318_11755 [Aliifodinibius salicampi]|uniref:Uncharacterized protein n=1 Tax=Fodinibius salicampi TaxID=1920655 RepID=A0ABT3Q0E9_9BACT|nr:PEP/pyruvate-binding domain-containing protein [Fodinibius salicampi]MCW9713575.1 hypothetical protein [Fodinibius salicampi]
MQVFIFGAAHTKSTLAGPDDQLVLEKLIKGQRVLDWTINGLRQAGIEGDCVSFIGGYKIEEVIEEYPDLHYTVNPQWATTHVIGSLRYALESWKGGDVLLTYADTIFRPRVFNDLLQYNSPVTIGIDTEWRKRIQHGYLQEQAEKVQLKDHQLKNIGRQEIGPLQADAQFSGLVMLKKHIVHKLYMQLVENDRGLLSDNDSLSDLLQFIYHQWDIPITTHDHRGLWAELDSEEDLAQFVFGTKAETLERIQPFVSKSQVCDQIHFPLEQWEKESDSLLNEIQRQFADEKLIIRSSSLEEDSWEASQAGAFLSVAGIQGADTHALEEGINDVITGFQQNGSAQYNSDNQVLVQPFITDVAMSGVAFSRHLENATPYYVINYDDESSRTDTVTSGSSANTKSISLYKNGDYELKDERIVKVVDAIEELERITGYRSLDIEFVLTHNDELYIVQVRPITIHDKQSNDTHFTEMLEGAKQKVSSRLRNYPHLLGETTILADMPDWNPAEMIGVRPKPLALSLYQYLITDTTWRNARAQMGYRNPVPAKLMYCIGGHPYIDVRNSFNNLIPDGLRDDIAEKIVNHYLQRLNQYPELHDKIEFEIAITCYSPDIEHHLDRLREDGFNDSEIDELKDHLRVLTEDAVTGKHGLSVQELVSETEDLDPFREHLLEDDFVHHEIPGLIHTLLDDCKEHGTRPFSILARYGFIASSMMRGFVQREVITDQERLKFLNSIETVAGRFVEAMGKVQNGTITREDFLDEYGHLRPGTYDITSYSYDENPEQYFPAVKRSSPSAKSKARASGGSGFTFNRETIEAIDNEIKNMGMGFSAHKLLKYVGEATAAREYAKFQFTKNVSAVLKLLAKWGGELGFDRSELSYLFIEDLLRLNTLSVERRPKLYTKQKIQEGKHWYKEVNKIETPHIIISTSDLEVIEHRRSQPNYVTEKVITAPICKLSEIKDKKDLKDKIVMTEGADPGYDWIFLHSIKGLITKYGGAASHMTIRCAEFGLPAAIGCGEQLFEQLERARNVELNCTNKQIKVLG